MGTGALVKQGILDSEFLFELTKGYVKDGKDEMGLPNSHRYRECVGYAARAAMFLTLGNVRAVQDYLTKAGDYKRFTTGEVPELDVFIAATAAKAAFDQKKFQQANRYAETAQAIALTLNGTTGEMSDYLLYVAELSVQIASHEAGS